MGAVRILDMENSLTVVPGLTPHVTASRPRLKAPASLRRTALQADFEHIGDDN